nr:hypothetical protein [Tanacetum cinerariifolium]
MLPLDVYSPSVEGTKESSHGQRSRVPVPLPEDPYETIRQAYLVGTDTESEPFEGQVETPKSPYIVVPPTCHVKDSEGSGTSGVRPTSSDFTAPLLPDHPLTHTTPALVLILHRTAHMAMHVSPAMSLGLSAGIAEVSAMSDLLFHNTFRSSYNNSPSPTLPVRKRYRGMSELILDTDSEEDKEVEVSLDFDSVREDAKDEGATAEDKDLATVDEGLAAGDEGTGIGVESHGLDDEGHSVKSDRFGLGDEKVVPEGQQRAVPVTALQRELQEMSGRITALKHEGDRRERGANRTTIDREWSRHSSSRTELEKFKANNDVV